MSTKRKPVSHFERKNRRSLGVDIKEHPPVYEDVIEQNYNEKTKRFEQCNKMKKVNPYERTDYRCSDFSMDNLAVIGAKLSPTSLAGDVSTSIENIESNLNSIVNE